MGLLIRQKFGLEQGPFLKEEVLDLDAVATQHDASRLEEKILRCPVEGEG